jgi:hypothetical protein
VVSTGVFSSYARWCNSSYVCTWCFPSVYPVLSCARIFFKKKRRINDLNASVCLSVVVVCGHDLNSMWTSHCGGMY